jgi:hypothetical protein
MGPLLGFRQPNADGTGIVRDLLAFGPQLVEQFNAVVAIQDVAVFVFLDGDLDPVLADVFFQCRPLLRDKGGITW